MKIRKSVTKGIVFVLVFFCFKVVVILVKRM